MEGLSNYDHLNLANIVKYDESEILEALSDGITVCEALATMDPEIFRKSDIIDDYEDAYQSYKNYRLIITGLVNFYNNLHGPDQDHNDADISLKELKIKLETMKEDIEQTSIRSINQVSFVNIETLFTVLHLALGVALNCDNTE